MNQNQVILDHLLSGKSLTAMEALHLFQCFRLAARIDNLKHEGYEIKTEIITSNGKRYARYFMAPVEKTNSPTAEQVHTWAPGPQLDLAI